MPERHRSKSGSRKPSEKERLFEHTPERFHQHFRKKIKEWEAKHEHEVAPAHRGETHVVPRLMAHVQGELVLGDTDVLMEYHDWSLSDYPARLDTIRV